MNSYMQLCNSSQVRRHFGRGRRFCKEGDKLIGVIELGTAEKAAFRTAVTEASARADVRAAVQNIYLALQDAIDLRKPLCATSGRCCRFDEYGHRLFVTTMEMAAFIADLGTPPIDNPGGCPFQMNGLCGVRDIRPFGCRVFFCDQTSTGWQEEQFARFHAELKRLHNRFIVPYFYLEWREALRLLNVA
jgi:Fe-S-cluster containining protein